MPTALINLAPAYRREVYGLGGAVPPDLTDAMIAEVLADCFAEGQLYGFFATYTLDQVTLEVDPDLDPAMQQLIILIAGIRQLRAQVVLTGNKERYKAGPVEYETERSASVLVELLKSAEARLALLLKQLVGVGKVSTTVTWIDAWPAAVMAQGAP